MGAMPKQPNDHAGTYPPSHGATSTDVFAESRVQDTYQTKTRVRWFDRRTERWMVTLT